MSERSDDKAKTARKVERLAAERQALFGAAGANAGRTAAVQARLTAIEQELDQCFLAVREAARRSRRRALHQRGPAAPSRDSAGAADRQALADPGAGRRPGRPGDRDRGPWPSRMSM